MKIFLQRLKILLKDSNHVLFNWKQLLICFIVLFLFLWLEKPIYELFNTYLVEKVLSKFPFVPLSKLEFLMYLILVFGITMRMSLRFFKTSYKCSPLNLFLVILLCSLYWKERLYDNNYLISPLSEPQLPLNDLTILDPIFLGISVILVVLLVNYFRLNGQLKNNSHIVADNPISNVSEDELDRVEFASHLFKLLQKMSYNSVSSFVIGINGKWGFGKSSILKLILNEIDDGSIKIEYNPWIASSKQTLIEDFFSKVENEVSEYIQTGNLISKYGSALAKIDNESNPLKSFASIFDDEKPLQDRFLEISSLIQKTNKKVYVFIDDLDRLDNQEVFEVLRLIRNTASFPSMIFIVAYDKDYLAHALKEEKIFNSRVYLDKIFQMEINLPRINELKLLGALSNSLNNQLDKLNLELGINNELKTQINKMIYGYYLGSPQAIKYQVNNHLVTVLRNKRDVIRFVNSFLFYMSMNPRALYLPDLFILELIKIHSSEVYEVLSSRTDYLITTGSGEYPRYELFTGADDIDFDDLPGNMRNKFRLLDFNVKINENEPEKVAIIDDLLNKLFSMPNIDDYNAKYSIDHAENLENYFSLTIPENQVSFEFIETLIKN
jgi:predicted KAP-like P-loop ATPase